MTLFFAEDEENSSSIYVKESFEIIMIPLDFYNYFEVVQHSTSLGRQLLKTRI